MTDWQALEKRYFFNVTKRTPLTLVRGAGVRAWDDRGREYLDFTAGWAVNALGHCHPAIVEALTRQAQTLIHTSNQFYTTPQIELAELLVKNSCLSRVFFANSGAEAVEGAVKLARRYGKLNLNGAYEVITAVNSFHGRTLAMTAATGQKKFHEPYEPLPEGFINVEFNSLCAIQKAITARTCAVMLEPVQGEGGVNVPDDDYLKEVRGWCDEMGILLILDEVQTGIGRLGTLFGYQMFGVEPDIMTLAKGLGGGVPIGAFMAKDRAAVFAPGEHGSTYGGNPLVCAAAHAGLKYILDHNVVGNTREVGDCLLKGLEALKDRSDLIIDVRGRGLLLAIEFSSDLAERAVLAAIEDGLLINPIKPNVVRLIPPLIITRKDADEALTILSGVLEKLKSPAVAAVE
ncbi:MAG: aspartate aminotransferase family protein [Chloroflexi bacterium]|nr:aspartate aminotransferase family protein [Chloroflexota bacterium]